VRSLWYLYLCFWANYTRNNSASLLLLPVFQNKCVYPGFKVSSRSLKVESCHSMMLHWSVRNAVWSGDALLSSQKFKQNVERTTTMIPRGASAMIHHFFPRDTSYMGSKRRTYQNTPILFQTTQPTQNVAKGFLEYPTAWYSLDSRSKECLSPIYDSMGAVLWNSSLTQSHWGRICGLSRWPCGSCAGHLVVPVDGPYWLFVVSGCWIDTLA